MTDGAPSPARPFRQGVGLVIFNSDGKVLIAARSDKASLGDRPDKRGAWQFPQGGMKKDGSESPEQAAMREALEEIGTDKLVIIDKIPYQLAYLFPDYLMSSDQVFNNKYCGQQQWWLAAYFYGDDADIRLENEYNDEHAEFSQWRWATLEEAVALVVDFKKEVYTQVAHYFAPWVGKIASGAFKPDDIPATPTKAPSPMQG
ncbi:MAG: RNA pyrophosphohydrolase [Alphaproteobacteria bacterium]|nr:RNA pyrophosphohydrolase [Alphaproteobacteria bacterium]NDG05538.1 RNA pyrophosphohydrolase [Alphaproteobacteria bacterium]